MTFINSQFDGNIEIKVHVPMDWTQCIGICMYLYVYVVMKREREREREREIECPFQVKQREIVTGVKSIYKEL